MSSLAPTMPFEYKNLRNYGESPMSQSHLSAALEILRDRSLSTAILGRDFEKLIQAALPQAPGVLGERFEKIWLWHEWPDHDGADTGIDLVAAEKDGGLCAIQCKCFDAKRRVSKRDIDGFLAASEPEHFTSRLLVNTGLPLTSHTLRTLERSPKPCRVLDRADLESWDVDWRQYLDTPEHLVIPRKPRFTPHPYQQEAVDAVIQGFRTQDRGQLILPCGTGKTAVTLWLAEQQVGIGGRVLYLVPSIALLAQTMREWSAQRQLDLRYVGICSDTRAGRTDEDTSLLELDYPVTTDPERIRQALTQERPDALTAVFCTYQSLPLVIAAQDQGAPIFDLVLCDEAHRTTGVEDTGTARADGQSLSPFRLVHEADRLQARKRLYTTATPRVYTEAARSQAADRNVEIYSMDDESRYGPVFYRMTFSEAIAGGWLTDYKVIILVLRSAPQDPALAALHTEAVATDLADLNLDDTVRLLGCWDALADPEGQQAERNITGDQHQPLRRVIAFTHTIRSSQRVAEYWAPLVDLVRKQAAPEQQEELLSLAVEHVDGTQHTLDRQRKLAWLQTTDNEEAAEAVGCRVLSNARCLTEGVDVPALDGVLFLAPRRSQVDVVQAVGRVMRRAPGKDTGYIILPVVIGAEVDPVQALDRNQAFQVVWSVLRALRSHDDRFDLEINTLDLNRQASSRIKILDPTGNGTNGKDSASTATQLALSLHCELPPGAIYAKVVEKCGDRKYWPQWAADVAQIADRIRLRVTDLLHDPERITVHNRFQTFLTDLQQTLNPSLQAADVVAMIAQHLVTGPVFQALFADYDFVGHNPVSRALNRLVELLEQEGLGHETRDLEPFYQSVRQRAAALDNPEARQQVLLELYERFFRVALKKEAERLGIVYTPIEVVDFLLQSADVALQRHGGRRLTDAGVQILDPFTGTGTFLVRLLQHPTLIGDVDLRRKFTAELHANEMVLLAYYIAAVNIEETYHGRRDRDAAYRPFAGMTFTDTFQLAEEAGQFTETLTANSERIRQQRDRNITVVVGNPPYSAGQKSATDDNPNVSYPRLEQKIRDTYATASPVTNKMSLYDSYKLAIRWASDRLGEEGVIAFVTNGSFLEGRADAGLRACLAQEFSHIYVVNLRGNARTQGERRRQEGGNIFGSGSRTPVALLILVKDPNHDGPAHIAYRDIGDYLSREQKLAWIQAQQSIAGIEDWRTITPDKHHDWLDQRDPAFQTFMPLGSKEAKSKKIAKPGVAIRTYSSGIKTNCDAWLYSFDRAQLTARIHTLIDVYEQTRHQVTRGHISLEEATRPDSLQRIKWHGGLRQHLKRQREVGWQEEQVRMAMYRPFVKRYLYDTPGLVQSRHRIPAFFPTPETPQQLIGVTGIGETVPFSTLITDVMPDLHLNAGGQWFARWHYIVYDPQSTDAWTEIGGGGGQDIVPGYRRVDNITDWCLQQFRDHYPTLHITKDDIWSYFYGILHAPDYRTQYRADLAKALPRIPFAPDFGAFCDAGAQLAYLHLHYETCHPYDLQVEVQGSGDGVYQLGTRPIQWGGTRQKPDRSTLHVTPYVTLHSIPDEAHTYVVNGRTPLEWAMDRLHIRQDKESGIVNDPNAWWVHNPSSLVTHLQRLVYVSVETAHIVRKLPPALADTV